jgi:hypothetical protein
LHFVTTAVSCRTELIRHTFSFSTADYCTRGPVGQPALRLLPILHPPTVPFLSIQPRSSGALIEKRLADISSSVNMLLRWHKAPEHHPPIIAQSRHRTFQWKTPWCHGIPPSACGRSTWVKGVLCESRLDSRFEVYFFLSLPGVQYSTRLCGERGTLTRSKVACPVLFWYSSDPRFMFMFRKLQH